MNKFWLNLTKQVFILICGETKNPANPILNENGEYQMELVRLSGVLPANPSLVIGGGKARHLMSAKLAGLVINISSPQIALGGADSTDKHTILSLPDQAVIVADEQLIINLERKFHEKIKEGGRPVNGSVVELKIFSLGGLFLVNFKLLFQAA